MRPPGPIFRIAALLAVVAGGCTRRHTVDRTETCAPRYDRLHIAYSIREGDGVLGSNAIQPVTFVDTDDGGSRLEGVHRWTSAELEVEYLHAGTQTGFARATLRLVPADAPTVRSHASESSTGVPLETTATDGLGTETGEAGDVGEVWVLDVPREQLDGLLVDLTKNGFFESRSRSTGRAHIAVRLDDAEESKAWDANPRLDGLAERVYATGRIHGFSPPSPTIRAWWSFR